MNDNDIIKALECCHVGKREHDCKKCPLYCRVPACLGHLAEAALDLINRQKAEIERLSEQNVRLNKECDHYINYANKAIEEFAKRLEADLGELFIVAHPCAPAIIDNLVKEMMEGEDGSRND